MCSQFFFWMIGLIWKKKRKNLTKGMVMWRWKSEGWAHYQVVISWTLYCTAPRHRQAYSTYLCLLRVINGKYGCTQNSILVHPTLQLVESCYKHLILTYHSPTTEQAEGGAIPMFTSRGGEELVRTIWSWSLFESSSPACSPNPCASLAAKACILET